MFTGLIQAIGSLELIASNRLRVMTADVTVFHDLAIGDSVAVDGVCLTAEETFPLGFVATVSPETLYRSTLADQSQRGGKVNLEPPCGWGLSWGAISSPVMWMGWARCGTCSRLAIPGKFAFLLPPRSLLILFQKEVLP